MKRSIFLIALLVIGCAAPSDSITYTRSNDEMSLKITYTNNGSSCSVNIKNAEEARKYRIRLQRLVRELEDFEKEISIKEK